jgi:hypothetical protein
VAKLFKIAISMAAIAAAGVTPVERAAAQQMAVTNIDIKMSRNSSKGPFSVSAEVTNPNDFAVKDIHVRCSIEDGQGNQLRIYESTIFAVFPARQKITIPRLDVGAWPEQATRASCTSSSAQRM